MPDEMNMADMGAAMPPSSMSEPQDDGMEMARYELLIPLKDNKGRNIPHALAALRSALSDNDLYGRTIISQAQGDWQEDDQENTQDVAIMYIDAPDDPETLDVIKEAAQGVKELSGRSQISLSVRPIRSYTL